MKPANGRYRLTTDPNPNTIPPTPSTTVVYEITDAGLVTTFGVLVWSDDENGGKFSRGDIAVRFLDQAHFVAINGAEGYSGVYVPTPI